MSMANKGRIPSEKDRIYSARYVPGARYDKKLDLALQSIPNRREAPRIHYARVAALAAALIVLLAFAAPPIVRAVGPVLSRIFGIVAQREREFLALPEDARLVHVAEDHERFWRGYDVMAEGAFRESSITLRDVWLTPSDPYDENISAGSMAFSLTYADTPPFDPNKVVYSAKVGGREYAMNPLTRDDSGWYTEEEIKDPTNTKVVDGVLTTFIAFNVDQWNMQEKTNIVLIGALDGEQFEISFTYDPALAHEAALAEAERVVGRYTEVAEENKDILTAIDEASSAVGIEREVGGFVYAITDFALTADNRLHTGILVYSVPEKNPTIAQHTYYTEYVLIDGYAGFDHSWDGDILDGNFLLRDDMRLTRKMEELPEESLITFYLTNYQEHPGVCVPVSFRYNWEEKRAVLAKDIVEEEIWTAENEALKDALAAKQPDQISYDLKPQNLRREAGGLTMALNTFEVADGGAAIYFLFEMDDALKAAGYTMESTWEVTFALTIGDAAFQCRDIDWETGIPASAGFTPDRYLSEVDFTAPVKFIYTPILIKDGEEHPQAPFEFEFLLGEMQAAQ